MTMRAALLAAAFLLVAPVSAEAAPEDVATDVAKEIMSPYCPGATLHDCPSQNAIELREEITGWAADGMTKSQIIERLEDEYGPSIRAVPRAEGSGLFAWLLPLMAVAIGGAVGYTLLKRWTGPSRAGGAPPVPAVTADDRARLEHELDQMRGEA